VDIVSCDVNLRGQGPFGQVSRRVLRVQGYLVEANISTLGTYQAQSIGKLKLKDKDGKWFTSTNADDQDWFSNHK
jgi:hypothetical protein